MRISIRSVFSVVLVASFVLGFSISIFARDEQPTVLKRVDPVYPPDLRRGNIEGKVDVEFVVDENGDVIAARIPEECASERWQFRFSAVVAVWQWKFKPGLKDDKPVKTLMRTPIEFAIEK